MKKDVWSVVDSQDWPPPGYPKPPISPSMHENLRECRLRVCFQSSGAEQYPRRISPAARIGIAFHQTLDQLAHIRSNIGRMNLEKFCQRSVGIFREQLELQRTKSYQESRECSLRWPDDRLSRAEDAVLVYAREVWLDDQQSAHYQKSGITGRQPKVERRLESRDGLLVGILDRIDLRGGRCRIIDYKTSLTKVEKAHTSQIKFYAYLWFDRYGAWPNDGLLVYPLLWEEILVVIDPTECIELANEVRQEARLISEEHSSTRLGNPGSACTHCEFKPWCRPFWLSQTTPANDYTQIERAVTGFEATVISSQESSGVLLIELKAIGRIVEVRLSLNQFPHLIDIQCGDRVRVLDTRLIGAVDRPTADVTEQTEIYRVRNALSKQEGG